MSALLEVDHLSVAFGGLKAVDDVSFTVAEGSIVGLIGSNGAGKTTTFNAVSGLVAPTAGSIGFAGRDITGLPPHRRARLGIGRSFQNLGLAFDETVETNVLAAQFLGARYRPWDVLVRPWRWRREEQRLSERARDVAARFGLADHLRTSVGDLSFAVARFAELAAVLAEEPRLMLLDEPTTGLDIEETARLLDVLRSVRDSGTTLLLVAHDVRFTMSICDHIHVLAEGRLIASGPPDEVRTDQAVITSYLGSRA